MNSCIYRGRVTHRRKSPVAHAFSYGLYMMYLDLDELPHLFDQFWLWSARGFNFARFKRSDHLAGKQSLKETILDKVAEASGQRPTGKVYLLTHLRYFGFGFNPVSFYYCFDEASQVGESAPAEKLNTIVAEVNNTPWGERHIYLLPISESTATENDRGVSDQFSKQPEHSYRFSQDKAFHVSPFLPMDMQYHWKLNQPTTRLHVHIENYRQQQKVFEVSMHLQRLQISASNLRKVLLEFPLMTMKIVGAIYYQAFRLWRKKIPFQSKPAPVVGQPKTTHIESK